MSWRHSGFSVHNEVRLAAGDTQALEAWEEALDAWNEVKALDPADENIDRLVSSAKEELKKR